MMTRKNYEAAVKRLNSDYYDCNLRLKKDIALFLCGFFAEDNPRFDVRRFLNACGLEKAKLPLCGSPAGDCINHGACNLNDRCIYFGEKPSKVRRKR